MAFFEAKLGDDVYVYIESEASGAFAKNAEETNMVPAAAFDNMVKIAGGVAKAFGDGVKVQLPSGATAELNFGVKAELSGAVMVANNPTSGQFSVTIRVVNA